MEVLEKEKHINDEFIDKIHALLRALGHEGGYTECDIQRFMSMMGREAFKIYTHQAVILIAEEQRAFFERLSLLHKARELPIASEKANLEQMNTPQEEDADGEVWTRIRATSEAGFDVEELEEYILQVSRLFAKLQAEEQRNFFEGLDLLHKNYYVLPKEPHPLSSTQLKKMIKHERNPLRKKQLQKELNVAYKQEKEGGR